MRIATRAAIALVVGLGVLASSTLAADASPTAAVEAEPRPDILLVVIDDHGYIPDERVLQRLPAIRETLLDGGLRLTQMYDETPLCCPARATLLSGQHTLHHGVTANASGEPDPTTTIATALSDAGYHTFMVGKYVNGPKRYRFPPGWDHVLMAKNKDDVSFFLDDVLTTYDGRFGDDVVRETAVQWLGEAPLDQPVFAYITPNAPHRKTCKGQGKVRHVRHCDYLPRRMKADRGASACAGIPPYRPPDYAIRPSRKRAPWAMPDWPEGWPLTDICESLLVVDRMIGELRTAQEQRGRPLWLVFLSDNGMSWGRRSYPLKHVPTATRLPFYVAGPGVTPGRDDTLLSNVDVAATLAEIGGTSLAGSDGTSFLPLLKGEPFEGRREVLELMPGQSARTYEGWAGYRTPEWRYIRWDDGRQELYDLVADPKELVNLAERKRGRVARMDRRLDELLAASRG